MSLLDGTMMNGQVVFDDAPTVPDGTRVQVVIPERQEPVAARKMDWLVGAVPDMPSDFAEEHNHYIHGSPRRKPKVEE